jgi:hypothetical protein
MSLRLYKNKRDKSEASIVEALERAGCGVLRMDKPVDLLCFHPGTGRLFLAECKTGKGKLNPSQQQFASQWPVHVLRTADEAINLVNEFRKD